MSYDTERNAETNFWEEKTFPSTKLNKKTLGITALESGVLEILLAEFEDEFGEPMHYLAGQAPRLASEIVYRLIRMDEIEECRKSVLES